MNGTLTRLKGLALRPLWAESAVHRTRRRCRTLITTPFAALGGLTWGVFAAPTIGVGSQILWGALGAFALPFFMYLEQRLIPAFAELARQKGFGNGTVASLVGEVGMVGGLVYLLTKVMGAPTVPAVGTALGIGAFYAVVMEYVLCGSAAADAARLIQGGGVGASHRPESYSHAQTLTKRGEHAAAVAIYREAIDRRPRDGAGYVRLSRALVAKGDFAEAVEALRNGFVKAKLSGTEEAFLVRQIHEIGVTKLEDPTTALADLKLLLEHQPGGTHAEWALREITDIVDGVYDDL